MKILIMTSLWGRHGGKEHYLECCVDELTRAGHECVIAYGRLSPKPCMMDLPPLRIYELSTYGTTRSDDEEPAAALLQEILNKEAPDAIFMCDLRNLRLLSILHAYGGTVTMSHDNWLTCMRGFATSYLGRNICTGKLGYKCLLRGCFLGKDPVSHRVNFNNLFTHQAMLESYQGFGSHLVASNYMKDRLLLHGFTDEQVRVVGYFTDLQPQTREPAAGQTPTILFMGQIHRYKGVDFLVRALAHLRVPFRCRVVGDGGQLANCKALAVKLGVADKIDFLGWLPRNQINEEILAASVIAVPSVWPEPFGLVGLEAMTCGKPVVAFATGGIPDWLVDGVSGFLVPVKQVDQMAEKISFLLQNPDHARQMGLKGQEIAQVRFPRAAHFQKLLAALEAAAYERQQAAPQSTAMNLVQVTGSLESSSSASTNRSPFSEEARREASW